MNPLIKKSLIFGFLTAFLILGVVTLNRSMPGSKETRIYNLIKPYSPYTLEKYLGGVAIINNKTGKKEKPSAAETFHRLDEVEKEWGHTHLKIVENDLIIMSDDGHEITKILIDGEKEYQWLKSFYGI